MSKLVATDEAVRVKMTKSEVLNHGAGSLASCWNVLQYELHKQFPGRVVRDFSIKTVDDSVEMTAYLGKLEEDKDEDTACNSDGQERPHDKTPE